MPESEQIELFKIRSQRAKKTKEDHPVSKETIDKIKKARSKQENVFNVGESLKTKIIVVDKNGDRSVIDKIVYEAQTGNKEDWEYVFHRTKIAQRRINMKDSVKK